MHIRTIAERCPRGKYIYIELHTEEIMSILKSSCIVALTYMVIKQLVLFEINQV